MEKLHPGHHEFFGTIRDPWTWYVSLFNHAHRSVQGRDAIRRYGGTFKSFIEGMSKKAIKDEGYTLISVRSDERLWKEFEGGLYSHWFEIFYQPQTRVFIDTAQMYEGVQELLKFKADPRKFPPLNVSQNDRKYKEKYSQEMIDLVWETDGPLAKRLGFTPFSASSHGAVIHLDGKKDNVR